MQFPLTAAYQPAQTWATAVCAVRCSTWGGSAAPEGCLSGKIASFRQHRRSMISSRAPTFAARGASQIRPPASMCSPSVTSAVVPCLAQAHSKGMSSIYSYCACLLRSQQGKPCRILPQSAGSACLKLHPFLALMRELEDRAWLTHSPGLHLVCSAHAAGTATLSMVCCSVASNPKP